jgi:phospholipid/cholesterol/gamma-HCH transport system substrate-binding protein
MQKRAPTLGNLLVIILFVLSCFALLMFLWESFGGPLPLKPKGYRFNVAFPRSFSLAEESDVRISGVEVGHVVSLKLNDEGRTEATVELNGRYAPIREDMHAILRTKTILGETYIQLIPEANSGPRLEDGERLPNSQVEP